jgi:hypothetical protein
MKIDVSIGELVDKVTILSIKLKKVKDPAKLSNIKKEYDLLKVSMEKCGITTDTQFFKQLQDVNSRLWIIEDDIRIKESRQQFDDDFIQLARSVYFENDQRAAIKKEINLKYGSELVEEKEYVDYKNKSAQK